MQPRKRKPHSQEPDAGSIFDAALARGLKLPDGLSPMEARRWHVEHPPTEWTKKDYRDWVAGFRETWRNRQDDPHWKAMRAELTMGLGGQPFVMLDRMPLGCDRKDLRAKIIESLADALDRLRVEKALRKGIEASREFFECELRDARARIGRHPEPWKKIIKDREAKAHT